MSDTKDKNRTADFQYRESIKLNPSFSATIQHSVTNQLLVTPSDDSDSSDKSVVHLADASTTDTMKKTGYLAPRFHKGNTKENCYIDFYLSNPETGILTRFKKTEGFFKCATLEECAAHGFSLVKKYESLIHDGWSPFEDRRRIIKNHLAYHKEKAPVYNIKYSINKFLDAKFHECRDKTYKTYKSKGRLFLKWLEENKLDDLHIADFTQKHAQDFLETLKKKKRQNNTYISYLFFLQSVWIWRDNDDENILRQQNPWRKFKKPPTNSTPQKPFNKNQRDAIQKHLLAAGEDHLWLACMCVYYGFVRPGRELHSLQVKHIDFSNSQITLEKHFTKNKKTQSITMTSELIKLFQKAELHKYPADYFIFTKRGICDKPVFRDYYSKRFTKIIRKIGYGQQYSMYSWKHTGNQVAHANGMPIEKQRKQNRHQSLDEMQKYLVNLEIQSSEELDKYYSD